MAAGRKSKADDGGARQRLIEAAVQIMHDEGYAAATSRRVAAKAGVKQALVYYYFPTMDDLFVEALRAGGEVALERLRGVLLEDDPLRALWRINRDPRQTGLSTEFMALGNHRMAVGGEIQGLLEGAADCQTAGGCRGCVAPRGEPDNNTPAL